MLLAINPFEELPLYGTAEMAKYARRLWDEVAPHPYAIAEGAFVELLASKGVSGRQ